ncbi:DctP family TRAP transporter solute-binding subunit [Desulfopila sp. IMCC35006]|uniref:TRAP transporter substrate-binding protein n=1 Tax=Desulfopila sp. IMCC35006 TaxID=2569542 RepID=UPI0010AB6555|nr:TRAP transporter substrate-binding protein [Desulfopila sp. IMCC35006]TKB27344.1 DctP family TRAP transporter solute-binding subunit [Desulfopila sp. IMCC35006]
MFGKITTLVATAALSAALISGSALASSPITIKFAHVVAENTPKGKMAIKLKDLVAERLGGKVVVEVFPNSQLFGDENVLEAMLLGDVQMAAPALSKFDRYTTQLQIFDLPFLFKDMAAVEKFQKSEKGQALLKTIEPKGLVGLGYLHNGLKQLSASTRMKVPADAAGLKFRIMSSDVLAAQFQALKAVPLKKPFSEVFTLLQTKAIDGQENTYSNIYSQKYFEIQPYITETNHGLLDYMVVTSKEFWMSIPDDIRPQLKAIIDEAIAYGNKISADKDLEDRQAIIDSKRTEIIMINDAERSQWVEAMKPVWQQFEKEIGKDMIDAAYQSNM